MTASETAFLADWGRATATMFLERLAITDFMSVFESSEWAWQQEQAHFFQNFEAWWSEWEQWASVFQVSFLPEDLILPTDTVTQEHISNSAGSFSELLPKSFSEVPKTKMDSALVRAESYVPSPFLRRVSPAVLPIAEPRVTPNEPWGMNTVPLSASLSWSQEQALSQPIAPFFPLPHTTDAPRAEMFTGGTQTSSIMVSEPSERAVFAKIPFEEVNMNIQEREKARVASQETKLPQQLEWDGTAKAIASPSQPLQSFEFPSVQTSLLGTPSSEVETNVLRPIQQTPRSTDTSFEPTHEPFRASTDWKELDFNRVEKSALAAFSTTPSSAPTRTWAQTRPLPISDFLAVSSAKDGIAASEFQPLASPQIKPTLFSAAEPNKVAHNSFTVVPGQESQEVNEDIWQKPLGNLNSFAAFANAAMESASDLEFQPPSLPEKTIIHEPTVIHSKSVWVQPPLSKPETEVPVSPVTMHTPDKEDFLEKNVAAFLQTEALLEALTQRIAQEYKRFYP